MVFKCINLSHLIINLIILIERTLKKMSGSSGDQCERRRLQKMKSKRKQILVKKAFELSKLCKLKVNVVVYDEESNVMQEFNSSPGFTSEHIVKHKHNYRGLKLN